MAFTTDITTEIGKVRLLITDLDSSNPIFPDDDMIQAFLDLEGSIKLAAALAYEAIAGNQALLLKVIQLLDLKQDGKSTAQGLLAVAEKWREQGSEEDSSWAGIDFADMLNDDFTRREYIRKLIEVEG